MLSEKIKIYIPKEVDMIISRDAEAFEFFKADGRSLNRNALLTRLIVNYSERFHKRREGCAQLIERELRCAGVCPGRELRELSLSLAERIGALGSAFGGEKCDHPISLKPTKASAGIIEYIESRCLNQTSLSEHFRNMFASYASLSQDEREKIIFREEYDAISAAIRENRKVFLTLRGTASEGFSASPYAISNSKEELHLYVLTGSKSGAYTVRLSRIASVILLAERSEFTDEQTSIFAKMLKYGPQFTYGGDEGEVIVELTSGGIKKFKRMYVHRPIPDRVEGNRYFFSCSHAQLMQYFIRFGADAYVVSPSRLRSNIRHFHAGALAAYNGSDAKGKEESAKAEE